MIGGVEGRGHFSVGIFDYTTLRLPSMPLARSYATYCSLGQDLYCLVGGEDCGDEILFFSEAKAAWR